MPITILNIPTNIYNYNKQLNNQLNVFLKTNVEQAQIVPLRTQSFEKDLFQKGGIHYTRPIYVHYGYHSNR